MTGDELAMAAARLSSGDPRQRIQQIQAARRHPTGDPRLLPSLEALLADTTPAVVSRPYQVGEARWLAAHALASERAAAGIGESVWLPGVPIPLSSRDLAPLQRAAGHRPRRGVASMLAAFARLQAMGRLPLADVTLNYTVPYGAHYLLREPSALQAALDDADAGVSEILSASRMDFVMPSYQLIIRTVKYPREEMGEGGISLAPPDEQWADEVILLTGARITVRTIGTVMVTLAYELEDDAWRLGAWGQDSFAVPLMIRHTELTPAQVKQARWLIKRRVTPSQQGERP